ncbi:MAG: sulfotransferase [Actinocatenispora sp.]
MLKVLYVAGWGRSGTTLLDGILGSHGGIFSGGEIRYLWDRGILGGRRCGCGDPLRTCTLWTSVLKAAYGDSPPSARRVVGLQQQLARIRRTPELVVDRQRGRQNEMRTEYGELLSRLYHGIAEVTGASVVVDSSKRPSDGALVAAAPGIDCHLVHMVRDPRAVAFSWMRRRQQPDRPGKAEMMRHSALDSATHWLAWNGAIEALRHRLAPDRYHLLRYEDFVAAPRDRTTEILAMLNQPVTDDPFRGPSSVALSPNHTVSGNPGRFDTGARDIVADTEWRHSQSARERRLVTAVTLPLLRRYDYPVRP